MVNIFTLLYIISATKFNITKSFYNFDINTFILQKKNLENVLIYSFWEAKQHLKMQFDKSCELVGKINPELRKRFYLRFARIFLTNFNTK